MVIVAGKEFDTKGGRYKTAEQASSAGIKVYDSKTGKEQTQEQTQAPPTTPEKPTWYKTADGEVVYVRKTATGTESSESASSRVAREVSSRGGKIPTTNFTGTSSSPKGYTQPGSTSPVYYGQMFNTVPAGSRIGETPEEAYRTNFRQAQKMYGSDIVSETKGGVTIFKTSRFFKDDYGERSRRILTTTLSPTEAGGQLRAGDIYKAQKSFGLTPTETLDLGYLGQMKNIGNIKYQETALRSQGFEFLPSGLLTRTGAMDSRGYNIGYSDLKPQTRDTLRLMGVDIKQDYSWAKSIKQKEIEPTGFFEKAYYRAEKLGKGTKSIAGQSFFGIAAGGTGILLFGKQLVTQPIPTIKGTATGLFSAVTNPLQTLSYIGTELKTRPFYAVPKIATELFITRKVGEGVLGGIKSARIKTLGEPTITEIKAGTGIQTIRGRKAVTIQQQNMQYQIGKIFKRKGEVKLQSITTSLETSEGIFSELSAIRYGFKKGRPSYATQRGLSKVAEDKFYSFGRTTLGTGKSQKIFNYASMGGKTGTMGGLDIFGSISAVTQKGKPKFLSAERLTQVFKTTTPKEEVIRFSTIGATATAKTKLPIPTFIKQRKGKIPKIETPFTDLTQSRGTGITLLEQPKLKTIPRSSLEIVKPEILSKIRAKELRTITKQTRKTKPLVFGAIQTGISTIQTPTRSIKTSPLLKTSVISSLSNIQKSALNSQLSFLPRSLTKTDTALKSIYGISGIPSIPVLTTGTIPVTFGLPTFDLYGTSRDKGGFGAIFGKYTPNIRGIQYGVIATRTTGRFSGAEVRGIPKELANLLGMKQPRKRKR